MTIDPDIAERIVDDALSGRWPVSREKVHLTRQGIREAVFAAVQEAHAIGFLQGREASFRESPGGDAVRPSWMEIPLDDPAAHGILQIRPLALRALVNAGYRTLGDLRWAPLLRLIEIHWIGRKTARRIRDTIEQLERDPFGPVSHVGPAAPGPVDGSV